MPCPQNSYSKAGSSFCLACEAGFNTSEAGAGRGACEQVCPPGTFGSKQAVGDLGIGPCQPCPLDFYQTATASLGCLPCPNGTGSPTGASIVEFSCRALCPPGTFSNDGLQLSTGGGCLPCPPGTFHPDGRATACLACAAGSFSLGTASECELCPPGQIAAEEGRDTCEPCDFGTFQADSGGSSCDECSPLRSTALRGAGFESLCVKSIVQVWGAGQNAWGQLGAGLYSNFSNDVQAEALLVSNDVGNRRGGLNNSKVDTVGAGYAHSLFVTEQGLVWAAGQNQFGQLGWMPSPDAEAERGRCALPDAADGVCVGEGRAQAEPQMLPRERLGNRRAVEAWGGRHSSLVLTDDGRLWSFGYNVYGQLGDRKSVV